MELRPYQHACIDAVYTHLQSRDDNPCAVVPTGCHAAGHPILMYDGSLKPVEEVAVGDRLMGPDSTPRVVLELRRGEDMMFRIVPTKGEPFVVNGEHILSLVGTNEGKLRPSSLQGGEISNVSVRDYLSRSASWRRLRKLYRVGVDFPHRPCLPIPPYVLGLLLGDGCFRDVVSLTTADETLARVWILYAQSIGCEVRVKDHGGRCPTYVAAYARGHSNILTEALKSLGLSDATSANKFIPDAYRTATRQDRLELLAGLMDADGTCHRAGFDYVTASRELAADVVFVARSLGLAAFSTRKYCVCQTGEGGWYFRVSIYGDAEQVPTRLPRKRPPRRRQIKSVSRTGFLVDPVGAGQYYGFQLDSDHLYVDGHFVVHHNSGKTPIMASICRDAVARWNGRVLILAHVKELLEQTADKLRTVCPDIPFGIYSAGLNRRDTAQPVIVAGIQSVFKRACELDAYDLVMVDEAHLIPSEGVGMYRQFLADARIVNPQLRIIGFTATPFRLKSGPICTPGGILNHVCYEIGVRELIVRGYLCPLVTKAGITKADFTGLHLRGGEFVADQMEALMDDERLVEAACAETVAYAADRRAVLIFASGVQHGEHIVRILHEEHGIECGFVTGETPLKERDAILTRFRQGELKYLCNVNVLTTGFDAPHIDCVALVRPTMSPGLYYQMCLDMETEVLTRGGWRRCHEVTTGDIVAAFDLETEEIVYVPAVDKVHRPLKPGEEMYGVAAPHLDLRVTDQHTMVVRGRARSCLHWQLPTAAEASRRRDSFTVPVAGRGGSHRLDAAISDAEVEFIGWFLTDGYMNRTNGAVTISQSTEEFAAEVRETLTACGFGFREYPQVRKDVHAGYAEGLQFVIPRGEGRGATSGLRGWSDLEAWLDKDIPEIFESLSRRQFALLLSAMNMANGCHRVTPGYISRVMSIAVGCRQRMADRIQRLAIERGYRCNVARLIQKPNDWNQSPQPQWMIHVKRQCVAYVGGARKDASALVPRRCRLQPVEFQRNEWVWCLTTERGTLVTRRNGKVAILGNCGRGFRLHPQKQNCLVLDFGGNVLRHGPVDALNIIAPGAGGGEAPVKECPECQSVIAAGYARCPDCGYEFPPPNRQKHDAQAASTGILTGQVTDEEYEVHDVTYSVHAKRGAPEEAPRSLRVTYRLGLNHWQSEFICVEHDGYARQKAEAWWRRRSPDPVPDSAERAVEVAEAGGLAVTEAVTVRSIVGEQYDRIVGYRLGPKPEPIATDGYFGYDPGDVPF